MAFNTTQQTCNKILKRKEGVIGENILMVLHR